MTVSTQRRVREMLRETGPLTVDELVARLTAIEPIPSKKPKDAVRNALTSDYSLCQSAGNGRYCYLPTFVNGATVHQAIDLTEPFEGLIAVGVELLALLWPMPRWDAPGRSVTFVLAGGPEVVIEAERYVVPTALRLPVKFPTAFWRWWEVQQAFGAGALLIRCDDGEAGRYAVSSSTTALRDAGSVVPRNAQLREAAAAALKGTHGFPSDEFARRLLARGSYHSDPPPDPVYQVLFQPPGACFLERGRVTYRPEITPTWRRVFAPRINVGLELEDHLLRELMQLTPPPDPEPEAFDSAQLPAPPAKLGYRVKVELAWDQDVWRTIEILDNQTLKDLHDAIQEAFGWDDDHLYSFFLSGRPWDPLTEVTRPYEDMEPPMADEVLLAELELKPKQRFLYIFDYGDQLHHRIQVVGTFPAPATGDFPRIVESYGKAPPQYPGWDEDEEESEEEQEEQR